VSLFRAYRRNNFLNLDLLLLSRNFETYELPKEKKYIMRYFKTPIQLAFLKYFMVFNDYKNFTDHTGISAQIKYLHSLHEKLIAIEKAHRQARIDMDMSGLVLIEKGKYKFRKNNDK
jgi:hypothetical protein